MEEEIWKELLEFPNYGVSNKGRIMNLTTDHIKKPSLNREHVRMVNFKQDQQQHIRSVARLVAAAFIDSTDVPEHFDTLIHLDGDRDNCAADNLAWRPRWFAILYHKQFNLPRAWTTAFSSRIRCVETGEVFTNTWDAATKYGMLEIELAQNVANGLAVPLQFYSFEMLD